MNRKRTEIIYKVENNKETVEVFRNKKIFLPDERDSNSSHIQYLLTDPRYYVSTLQDAYELAGAFYRAEGYNKGWIIKIQKIIDPDKVYKYYNNYVTFLPTHKVLSITEYDIRLALQPREEEVINDED